MSIQRLFEQPNETRLLIAYVGDGGWCLHNAYPTGCGTCGGGHVASTLVRCNSVSLKPANLQWRVSATTVWITEANGALGSSYASYVNANGHYVYWTSGGYASNVGTFADDLHPRRAGFHLYRPSDGYCAEPLPNAGLGNAGSLYTFPTYSSSNTQHSSLWSLTRSTAYDYTNDAYRALDGSSLPWRSAYNSYLSPSGAYNSPSFSQTTNGVPGEWLHVRWAGSTPMVLYSFAIQASWTSAAASAYPKRLAVWGSAQASDSPTAWTLLYRSGDGSGSGDEPAWNTPGEIRSFTPYVIASFKVYRWVFESIYTQTVTYAELTDLKLNFRGQACFT